MRNRLLLPGVFALLFAVAACLGGSDRRSVVLDRAPPQAGTLPEFWYGGVDCDGEPPIQVHAYNEDLYILRQSKCAHFESPFIYLIFGQEKALLLDTGAPGDPPLAATVDELMQRRRAAGGPELELVVAHSHAHFDHVFNDGQFVGRPNTTIVGRTVDEVSAFYGIERWPEDIVTYDLGGRVLDVIPTPGHESSHVALYDRRTQILLTGDTLYPGFLFVFDPSVWTDFRKSTRRMVDFVADHPVTWILGCHVEMKRTPGEFYMYGTKVHPEERRLELEVHHLLELDEALEAMGDDAEYEKHDDFVVYPFWRANRARSERDDEQDVENG
ncbi:MAG: MBL fold metallo-hydrolase [Planctomycetota bacterium]|nr:MBL fold metallo-hydrolase [Planctomycetota bacterium]